MAIRICRWLPETARTLQVFVLSSCLVISMSSARIAVVKAEPVSIKFNATVGPPNTVSPFDVPFDMPFSFNEGDTVTGEIVFEPLDVPEGTAYTDLIQTSGATFQINTQMLKTTAYSIAVSDDELVVDGPDAPYDEIRLNCGPFTGNNATCDPNSIPGADDILWSFSIGLQGESSVLEGADIPAEIADWNALNTWRSLSMSFREVDGPGIRRLTATIGDFVIAPEPSALTLAFLVCMAACFMRIRLVI